MLLWLILQMPITLLNAATSWLPQVTALPLGLDAILIQGMGYLLFLFDFFPPFQALWNAFIIVMSFKIGLKMFAMIPVLRHMLFK